MSKGLRSWRSANNRRRGRGFEKLGPMLKPMQQMIYDLGPHAFPCSLNELVHSFASGGGRDF